jgi:predicted nucleic acid-binding protein
MFLVDTDVLSALAKRRRHASVDAWIGRQRSSNLFISVISIGEIERGIALQRAKDPNFAAMLATWLDQLLTVYGDRVLPFDLASARRWGQLSAALGHHGPDLQIAATALEHGLTVVTRNISDFEPTGVSTLDPFSSPPRRTP